MTTCCRCSNPAVFSVWDKVDSTKYCADHMGEVDKLPVSNLCPICNTPGIIRKVYVDGHRTKACMRCLEAADKLRRVK